MMSLGKRIKAERELQGLTQEELGNLSGAGQQTIQALESRGSKKSTHASKIADALGVNLSWLLGESKDKFPSNLTPNSANWQNLPVITKRLIKLISNLSIKQQEALETILKAVNEPVVQDPSSIIQPRKKTNKKRSSAS
jgi:transcriptional regulator with XRE-family HTH domain